MKDKKSQGLYAKYHITKTNGKPIDSGARYFVLRYDSDGSDPKHLSACRKALRTYAMQIRTHLPELSRDLMAQVELYQKQAITNALKKSKLF